MPNCRRRAALKARLRSRAGAQLEHGVHLIVARSADGSLVVGDSHHYGATPDPFAPSFVDDLILEEYAAVFDGPPPPVVARWTGTYASAPDRLMLTDRPSDAVRIVLITSGTGASTSFAIAEETIADLYGAVMSEIVAVIFDWAGTLVDYGSRAPMGAFVETFAEFGVEITIEEARGPMGMAKRPHIAALCALPRVRAAWATRHGGAPTRADIDALYDVFVPKNVAVAAAYADAIPGAADTLAALAGARASRSAPRPATRARSWRRSCRARPSRGSRPTASSAPATRPRDGRAR